MTIRVVVVGAAGFGREALDVLDAMIADGADIEIVGVVDDAISGLNRDRLAARGVRFLGTRTSWFESGRGMASYVLGIGNPAVRQRLADELDAAGLVPFTAIHPSVTFGACSVIGVGTVVCAGVAISNNVRLGRHVHVNPNATIGHDSVLADFVSVNPAAVISGDVRVGEQTLVGAAATVLQQLEVGASVVVGAGAVVTKCVADGVTVVGVPARAMVTSTARAASGVQGCA
ncbi:MAG: NeuD/PglB/VioB family sugar acetyltransferase [Nigerium sp.]|nr:NeuD/PglB/VioB family sugar acetyltransferase [Nigerium sp.]